LILPQISSNFCSANLEAFGMGQLIAFGEALPPNRCK